MYSHLILICIIFILKHLFIIIFTQFLLDISLCAQRQATHISYLLGTSVETFFGATTFKGLPDVPFVGSSN